MHLKGEKNTNGEGVGRWALLMACGVIFLCSGCDDAPQRRESHFDLGESAYRSGQYESAHQHYGIFLRQNPDPQLARLAERRILSIEREIECVLGRKNGPRPAYVQQSDDGENVPTQYPRVLNRAGRAQTRE